MWLGIFFLFIGGIYYITIRFKFRVYRDFGLRNIRRRIFLYIEIVFFNNVLNV